MFSLFQNKGRESITAADLAQLDLTEASKLYVDVREQSEWDQGHIMGFTHMPLSEITGHISEFKKYTHIYFLCRSGGRSGMACDTITELRANDPKIPAAINIEGGIIACEKAGIPIAS